MRDCVALLRRLSLAGCKPRISPVSMVLYCFNMVNFLSDLMNFQSCFAEFQLRFLPTLISSCTFADKLLIIGSNLNLVGHLVTNLSWPDNFWSRSDSSPEFLPFTGLWLVKQFLRIYRHGSHRPGKVMELKVIENQRKSLNEKLHVPC